MAIITLGIDPGSRITGFGVVSEETSGEIRCLAYGTIEAGPKEDMQKRLLKMGEGLSELIRQHQPNALALEKAFFAKNADSALKLGQARGVILYEAARAQLSVFEYASTEIKSSLVGNGRAEKEQVQYVVQKLLRIQKIERLDASDALALAIHHSRMAQTRRNWAPELDL